MNPSEAKKRISELVDKYKKIVTEGKDREYNEADTRKDFIEPLFQALGWDVRNKEEVAAEEKTSGGRVDYSFKINGIPEFYLEAKSLKKGLAEINIEQAIDYAHTKGCTWAILTDFKRIEVYNAEWKEQNPGRNLFFALNVNQFLTDERLFWLSKDDFDKGLLDKEAEKYGKKTKKIPIDKQLLNDLTTFRELLSKSILKNNASENLTEEELDEAVQRILDRLIFIRYLEDKKLEPPKLRPLVRDESSKKLLYKRLNEVYRNLGIPYNSILFLSHLCDDLIIDDEILKKVIDGLYKTSDETIRYDFEIISADVLGNVYEQYLGHILKKTEKRAKLTEVKTHRKEQGIYYTPTYIVDYIVKNTLGELLKDKNVDVSKIKILDPACGSGSFLIKAFDVLEEYQDKHNKRYSDAKKEFDFPRISKVKTDIVLNNLYGVDLDAKAIEISQLNLLLKMVEKEQKLPLLHHNLKCGNSLIDDPEVDARAFNWEKGFKEIMDEGGFDVVVGNPPWGATLGQKEKQYIKSKFASGQGIIDTFALFVEKAGDLLKPSGYLGLVLPDIILLKNYPLIRKYILDNFNIIKIVYHGTAFRGVNLNSVTLILQKTKPKSTSMINIIIERDDVRLKQNKLPQSLFMSIEDYKFNIYLTPQLILLKNKLNSKFIPMGKIGEAHEGIHSGNIRQKLFVDKKLNEHCYKLIFGRDEMNRYFLEWRGEWVYYDKEIVNKSKKEYAGLGKKEYFIQPKIFLRRTGDRVLAVPDELKYFASNNLFVFLLNEEYSNKLNLKYLTALLNSKLMTFFFRLIQPREKQLFAELKINHINLFPIAIVDSFQQQPLIKLVDKMLSLNKRLNELGDKKTTERERIEKEIEETDKEIDELVYKIYDITEEEKKVIEGSLR